jgi:hypothetical protein
MLSYEVRSANLIGWGKRPSNGSVFPDKGCETLSALSHRTDDTDTLDTEQQLLRVIVATDRGRFGTVQDRERDRPVIPRLHSPPPLPRPSPSQRQQHVQPPRPGTSSTRTSCSQHRTRDCNPAAQSRCCVRHVSTKTNKGKVATELVGVGCTKANATSSAME